MPDDASSNTTNLVALRDARERAIELLQKRYADDVIDVDEFERRLETAQSATTVAALDKITADLEVPADGEQRPAISTSSSMALVPAGSVEGKSTVFTMFSGNERKGAWRVARVVRVVNVMGGTELDFREAQLAPGDNYVKIFCMWGGVEIIVPPELHVTVNGMALMGGFGNEGSSPGLPDPDAPRLHISGLVLMGGVDVNSRYPGETNREARKRKKRERKKLRQEQRRQLEERKRKELGPTERKELGPKS
ncbi:MAG: LiaF-related protein [Proteobacteria bacterium]|nr:LiaF-related protein [Pseudomonadota bacterium]